MIFGKTEQELQQIKEHLSLSISYRSHSFTLSASRDLIHLGPRCRSLKTLRAGDAFRPPSRTSLLRGVSAIASTISCLEPPCNSNMMVSNMSDLIPWAESRCSIELGRGVAGTVLPLPSRSLEDPRRCQARGIPRRVLQERGQDSSSNQWPPMVSYLLWKL